MKMWSNHITSVSASLVSLTTLNSSTKCGKKVLSKFTLLFVQILASLLRQEGLITCISVQHSALPKLSIVQPLSNNLEISFVKMPFAKMLNDPSAGHQPTWQICSLAWPSSLVYPLYSPSGPIQMLMSSLNHITGP